MHQGKPKTCNRVGIIFKFKFFLMKTLKFGLVAIIALIAAIGSSFTVKEHKGPNTVYYFANTTHADPPGTNDYSYFGTTEPLASAHCSSGVPICFGSSSSDKDSNGHPTGTVTGLASGNWSN